MTEQPLDLTARVHAALVASLGRVSVLVDPDGMILWTTPSVTRLLGYSPEQLVGRPIFELYDAEQARYSRHGFEMIAQHPDLDAAAIGIIPRVARLRHLNGQWISLETFASPMLADPQVRGVLVEWFPVSDPGYLIAAIDSLALGRPPAETMTAAVRLTEALVSELSGGILTVLDEDWVTLLEPRDADAAALAGLLPPPDHAAWREPWVRLPDEATAAHAGGRSVAALPLRTADGDLLGAYLAVRRPLDVAFPVVTTAQSLFGVALRMASLTLAQHRAHDSLRRAAEVDPLTGLLNRAGLDRELAELAGRRDVDHVVVVFVDLDDFKPVNDTYGHAVGDELLVAVAGRLRVTSRPTDIVGRLGGDEFVVVAPLHHEPTPPDGTGQLADLADRLAARLHVAVTAPLPLDEVALSPAASMGVSFGPASQIKNLFKVADDALYEVKRGGKGAVARGGAGGPRSATPSNP